MEKPTVRRFYALELVIVFLCAFFVYVILREFATFIPYEWDTLRYINIAINPGADTSILNRYTHIYLIKFFQFFSSSPLDAASSLWAFQVSFTAALVYLNARLLSGSKSIFPGLLALIFFLAQRKLFRVAGTPLVDLTTMMFMALAIFLYLVYIYSEGRGRQVLLILLGAIFFIALKSKETSVVIGLLLVGASLQRNEGKLALKQSIRNLAMEGAGVGLAITLFAFLNWTFIHDIYFGLRLSDWKELLIANNYYLGGSYGSPNYYDLIFSGELLIPFLAAYFVVLGKKSNPELRLDEKLLWLLPLALISFLVLSSVNSYAPAQIRYLYSFYAIVPVLAAQIWRDPLETAHRQRWNIYLLLITSVFMALLAREMVYPVIEGQGPQWANGFAFDVVGVPVVISCLLVIYIFRKEFQWGYRYLALPLMFLGVWHTILGIPSEINRAAADFERGFYPLKVFENNVRVVEGTKFYISGNLLREQNMLCSVDSACAWMLNVYFGTSLNNSNIVVSDSLGDLIASRASYGYLTYEEYINSDLNDDFEAAGYGSLVDEGGQVVLIFAKKP